MAGALREPTLLDIEDGDSTDYGGPDETFGTADFDGDESLRPINRNLLSSDEATAEWRRWETRLSDAGVAGLVAEPVGPNLCARLPLCRALHAAAGSGRA